MGSLDHYNLAELGTFIGVCGGVVASILFATQKSKCKKCCWGCIERDVDAVIAEERLEMTGASGLTPRLSQKQLNIEAPEADAPTEA